MRKVAVLGSGQVGEVLSNGFLKHGYAVMRGSRDPSKLAAWQAGAGADALIGTFAEAARWAETVVLAVKGDAAEAVLEQAGIENLRNKPVLDTTNPIAPVAPEKGVLRYFTTHDESLMERLQRKAPEAQFVKVFSCVGNALMVNPALPGGPPTMFICGDSAGAKVEVTKILRQFGWEVADMGPVEAARAIEPLCMLWCIPGFQSGNWMHAFKLLKLG